MYDLFYYLGGALTVLAVVLAAVGMRSKDFPSSKGQLYAVGGGMLIMVLATTTWAVRLAGHEKAERDANEASAAKAGEQGTNQSQSDTNAALPGGPSGEITSTTSSTTGGSAPSGAGETLKLTSPSSGALMYDKTALSAKAGSVTIDYTNPSQVPHSIAISDASGKQLSAGDQVSGGADSTATADLKPGKYTFFCTVPGHEQAGMKGTLTVK